MDESNLLLKRKQMNFEMKEVIEMLPVDVRFALY